MEMKTYKINPSFQMAMLKEMTALKKSLMSSLERGFSSWLTRYMKCESCGKNWHPKNKVQNAAISQTEIEERMLCRSCTLSAELEGKLRWFCCKTVYNVKQEYEHHVWIVHERYENV